MGTEVLRPQDCLIEGFRVSSPSGLFSRRRNYQGSYNPNPIPNPACNNHCNYSDNNNSHYQNNSGGGGGRNVRVNRKTAVRHERPDQRRHQRAQSEPSVSRRPSYDDNATRTAMMARRPSADDLAMEKVTILRRGESLDSKIKAVETERLGPVAVYAGSGFAVSPAPSSLPLPSFSKKQVAIDDSATRDIKRLLRLES